MENIENKQINKNKYPMYIGIVLVVVAIILAVWVWRGNLAEAPVQEQGNIQEENQNDSLGASIYKESQNPIDEELESTNPFEQSYQNPFE